MKPRSYLIAIIAFTALAILATVWILAPARDSRLSIFTNAGQDATASPPTSSDPKILKITPMGLPDSNPSGRFFFPFVLNELSPAPQPRMVYSTNYRYRLIGDQVVYSLAVENSGRTAAANVVISDTLSSNLGRLTILSSKGVSILSTTSRNWSVEISKLEPGETVLITVEGRILDTAAPTTVFNTAEMTYAVAGQTLAARSNTIDLHIVAPPASGAHPAGSDR